MLGILIVFAVIVEPRQGKEIQPYGNFVSAQTLAEGMDGKIDVAEHESSACATGKTLVDRSDLCGRLPFPQYRLKAMQCPNYRSESYISTGGGPDQRRPHLAMCSRLHRVKQAHESV